MRHSCVISSEKVIRKLKLDPGVPVIALEEIAKDTTVFQKLSALLMAYLVPRGLLLKLTAQDRVHTLTTQQL